MGFQSLAECIDSDSADVTLAGISSQILGPKARLATFDSLTVTGSTIREGTPFYISKYATVA